MSDPNSTYHDRQEYLRAVADPQYSIDARYREEVGARLARSLAAGTVTPLGQFSPHGESQSFHTRIATDNRAPEAIYGSHNPMPGADPLWAEAAKVGSGTFDGPEAIARAMGAPAFETDPSYREAVSAKIGRSILAGTITSDLAAIEPQP